MQLELLHCSSLSATKQPLLFLHGSFHAAWCYERWLPFFAARGHDSFALSFRSQGGSAGAPLPSGVAGTLQTHAMDVASVAATLPGCVIVGHSFGGLVLQELLSARWPARPAVSAAVLLCSVPPSGNSAMAGRMLRATPLRALRLTYAMVSRQFTQDAQLCRDTFFSDALPDAELRRFMAAMASSGDTRLLDLRELGASLPVPPRPDLPFLVLGAMGDAVVDLRGLQETAAAFRTEPRLVPGGHDVQLDTHWREAAELIGAWLDGLP